MSDFANLDTILIQHGRAHEIWRGKTKAQLAPMFYVSIIEQMVECPTGVVQPGDAWDSENSVFIPTEI